MIGRFALVVLLVAGTVFAITGCTNNSSMAPVSTGPTTDQAALTQAVSTVDSVSAFSTSDEATIDDGGMHADEYSSASGTTPDYAMSTTSVTGDSIYPIRWGRHVTGISRQYDVQITGDTLALVTITKTITGVFRVGLGVHTPDTTYVDSIINKPFTMDVNRKVLFKRIAHTDNPLHNWVPVAVTMVEGTTDSGKQFSITSIEVSDTHRGYDTTFTDPLNSWFRLGLFHGCIPEFVANDSITVRVTVSSSDTSNEIVNLRHDIAGNRLHPDFGRLRMPLVSVTGGAGSYTRVYARTITTHFPAWGILAERFNLIVDVMSHGSIYDNSAPFANEFWGSPYITVR
ncbi:MAG TPA: hypothetical protein VLY03_06150 [Bacteroidota bacterium]|nr:hypothetical protein [Bacteroidota bacterium]